ncbi:MAG: response regulator [Alphaproteobacteria bacterium]
MSKALQLLLVEDNAADVALLQDLFADGRHVEMHWVTDGEGALDFLHRRGDHAKAPRPDLVLLDLGLPRVSGHDVLAALREDPRLSGIPVIVLTTSRNPLDSDQAGRLGARLFLSKPRNLEGYEVLVDRLMSEDIPRLARA